MLESAARNFSEWNLDCRMQKLLNNKLFAVFAPALVGLGGAAVSVVKFELSGGSLFLAPPLIVSFLSSFAWSFKCQRTFRNTYGVASFSILALGGLVLIFAIDGLICLLMALPLAFAIGLIGTWLGRGVGSSIGGKGGAAVSSLLCILFPFLVGFENANSSAAKIRVVTTSLEMDAPITEVWDTVVAFPKISEPPTGIFRMGIAYPIEARIDGTGVGAIRYCTFSTGSFVEPITEWEEPGRLSFDVTENPPPMQELSLYRKMHAPHLNGRMVSKKGQFRLNELNGHVLLEGTTWYSHSIAPEFYWGIMSDAIIHRIHRRVLNHIKRHAEEGDN